MSVTTDNHVTTHTTEVAAPAARIYRLIEDVTSWPLHFAPNIHVELLESAPDGGSERIRIWATAGGEVKRWTSRRELDRQRLTIAFRQEVSQPPVAAMGGLWTIAETRPGHCLLRLDHDFRAVGDDPSAIEWITTAVDRNSTAELAAVKRLAELGDQLDELSFSFSDSLEIEGSPDDVYDFLNRADLWPERIPHVERLDLKEEEPGIQVMAMDTRAVDGSVHTTESVRICFPAARIVYKQTVVPALMTAHTGRWEITPTTRGAEATSYHSVTIRPENVERVLGDGSTVADARTFVQRALSTNSSVTLQHAKAYAEARRG